MKQISRSQLILILFIVICSASTPSSISFVIDASTPRFDPASFGIIPTAQEVVSKRTEKAVTFEVSPGKFASVSAGEHIESPSCNQATLSTLCRAVSLVRGIIPNAFALSQGPNSPGTAVEDASYGTLVWTNPSDVTSSNNTYATVSRTLGPVATRYIKTTAYGFAITAGATIDGIVVEYERSCSADVVDNYCIDSVIKLVKGGTVQGDNKANLVTNWSTTEGYFSYGSSSDLWGLTFTAEEINASDFGTVLSCTVRGNA